jgi:hypothetical protein
MIFVPFAGFRIVLVKSVVLQFVDGSRAIAQPPTKSKWYENVPLINHRLI